MDEITKKWHFCHFSMTFSGKIDDSCKKSPSTPQIHFFLYYLGGSRPRKVTFWVIWGSPQKEIDEFGHMTRSISHIIDDLVMK
jgi:hypothetical protein